MGNMKRIIAGWSTAIIVAILLVVYYYATISAGTYVYNRIGESGAMLLVWAGMGVAVWGHISVGRNQS